MYTKKVIRLKNTQIKSLDETEKQIKAKGGEITTTKLIRDAVQIFLDYFKDDAIQKYSGVYKLKEKKTSKQVSEIESN